MLEMNDKVVMVTGATNGVGKITALEIARMGATVIIVSRNTQKCKQTVSEIQKETGNHQVETIPADLSSQAQIHHLATTFLEKYDQLDVLINNAGMLFHERKESEDGIEMTMALNHLNYFLLTHLLLDILKQTAQNQGAARIVNVASEAHTRASISFDDLQRTQKYSRFNIYSESKLMNIMFTYALARRLEGTNITVNALHPGFVDTGFGQEGITWWARPLFAVLKKFAAIDEDKGAETQIYLATSPDVKAISGQYFDKKRAIRSNAYSYNEDAQERLMQISAELTNIKKY